MAVRFNPAREAELDRWWSSVREEMLSEHFLVAAVGTPEQNRIELEYDDESRMSTNFEFFRGVPVISLRWASAPGKSGGLVKVTGDSMGSSDPEVCKVLDDPDLKRDRYNSYSFLNVLEMGWDGVRKKVDERMNSIRDGYMPREDLQDALFRGLALDEDAVDRATFYAATRGFSAKDLFEMKESLASSIRTHFMAGIGEPNGAPGMQARANVAMAMRSLETTFSDWNRLAGRLDWRLASLGAARGEVRAEDVAATAMWAFQNPAYAAYREKSVPSWAVNRCKEYGLDRAKVESLVPKFRDRAVRQVKL